MERKFSGLGKLNPGDWGRGLLMAVIGAVLGVIYEALTKGIPNDWLTVRAMLITSGGAGALAAVSYILKNLGTGSGGQVLTNDPGGK